MTLPTRSPPSSKLRLGEAGLKLFAGSQRGKAMGVSFALTRRRPSTASRSAVRWTASTLSACSSPGT